MRVALLSLLILCGLAACASEPPATQGSIQVLFTPWNDAEGALIKTIGQARHSLHVQAFVFTSRNIADALLAAQRRGVKVAILADAEQATRNENSQLGRLHDAGIDVRLEVRYASAHNKIMLIDAEEKDAVIVTGSYNFSYSAQARNAENLLLIRDHASLMQEYLHNWRRHRDDALNFDEVIRP